MKKRLLNKTKQTKEKPHYAILYTNNLDYSDPTKIQMHLAYELDIKVIWVEKFSDMTKMIKMIGK